MKTWKGSESFAENAKREPEITARLSEAELNALCSLVVSPHRDVGESVPKQDFASPILWFLPTLLGLLLLSFYFLK